MENGLNAILVFFQSHQGLTPGTYAYNDAFCSALTTACAVKDASIWRLDDEGALHMVFGTDVPVEELSEIKLFPGEGISGAAAISRKPIVVMDAFSHPQHSPHVDRLLGYQTRAMISAPVIFRDFMYGIVNILNPVSMKPFSQEQKDYVSAAATMYAASLDAAKKLILYDPDQGAKQMSPSSAQELKKPKTVVVGISPAIQEALVLCLKSGRMDMPVLICGETGSGKELAARRIHEASRRSEGPFVEVNCAALPEPLFESELFGHGKGAFSGANRSRQGKFLAASGGTLFLDEVADMSLACQAKILRALQENQVTPVGLDKPRKCDVRVIAATNYNLMEQVKKGAFREDLYYRLCGIEIVMPPLRDRMEDLYPLAIHFIQKIIDQQRGDQSFQTLRISKEALDMLHAYHWPGNVRQLKQAIGAAAAICEKGEIRPQDFPRWLRFFPPAEKNPRVRVAQTYTSDSIERPGGAKKKDFLKQERFCYLSALEDTKYRKTGRWNLAAAAAQLDIPRKTFTYRLKKMGLV